MKSFLKRLGDVAIPDMWDAVSQIINNSQKEIQTRARITKNIRIRYPNHLGSDNFLFSPARIIHCIDDKAS